MVDKGTEDDLEDAEDVEEVTNELVVVVLQLLLGVPAVAIVRVSHLLGVDFWELQNARLLLASAQGILTRICAISRCLFFNWISCRCGNYFL